MNISIFNFCHRERPLFCALFMNSNNAPETRLKIHILLPKELKTQLEMSSRNNKMIFLSVLWSK